MQHLKIGYLGMRFILLSNEPEFKLQPLPTC